MSNKKKTPVPQALGHLKPKGNPLLSPTPIANQAMEPTQVRGGNSAVSDWVAAEHKGPYEKNYPSPSDPLLQVPQGQLTFDAEGTEGGKYHSRKAHQPGGKASGVTLGRGYDMGRKKKSKVMNDLTGAGISDADAKTFAKSTGKKGASARKHVRNNKMPEISLEQQKNLFATTYDDEKSVVDRISNKKDVKKLYGEYDVDKGNPKLRDLMVDMKYRGDYTPARRKSVQKLAANLSNRKKWASVPDDRFERRKAYAQEAAQERVAERNLPLTFAAPISQAGNPDYDLYGRKKPKKK